MGQNLDDKGVFETIAYYVNGVWGQSGLQARRGSGNSVVDGEAGVGLGKLHMELNKDQGVMEPDPIFEAREQCRLDFSEMSFWQQYLFEKNFEEQFKEHMEALGHNLFNLGDMLSDADVAALKERVPGFKREGMRAWNVAATLRSPLATATRKHTDNNTRGTDRAGKDVLTYQMAFTHGSDDYKGQRIYLVCAEMVGGDKKLLCHSRLKAGCENAVVIVALTKKHGSSLFTAQLPHFLPRYVASVLSPAELANLMAD